MLFQLLIELLFIEWVILCPALGTELMGPGTPVFCIGL